MTGWMFFRHCWKCFSRIIVGIIIWWLKYMTSFPGTVSTKRADSRAPLPAARARKTSKWLSKCDSGATCAMTYVTICLKTVGRRPVLLARPARRWFRGWWRWVGPKTSERSACGQQSWYIIPSRRGWECARNRSSSQVPMCLFSAELSVFIFEDCVQQDAVFDEGDCLDGQWQDNARGNHREGGINTIAHGIQPHHPTLLLSTTLPNWHLQAKTGRTQVHRLAHARQRS